MSSKPFAPNTFGVGYPTDTLDNNGYKLYITGTSLVILAGVFVALRFWVRLRKGNIGADDLTILVSLLFSVSLTVCMNQAVSNGYGVKKALLSKPQLAEAMKYFFIAQVVYKVECMFTKISLILLYLRIFVSKNFRIACFVSLAIVLAWSIGSIASTIWQCIPIEASWNNAITNKVCVNSDASWYQYGIINIVTDVMILALPIRPILKLQLHKREKFALLGVFALGAFVCIVSICRVVVVANSTQMKEDQTGNFIPRSSLTLVEANVGIISACLPTLGTLLVAVLPRRWISGPGRSYELSDSSEASKPQFGYPRVENSTTVSAHREEGKNGGHIKARSIGGHVGLETIAVRGGRDSENDSVQELLFAKPSQKSRFNGIEVRRDVSVQKT